MKTKNIILLTGAGFTKNFGGFLGMEMWSKIFNFPAVHHQQKLRELLLSNFDFEDVYYQVLGSSYSEDEREVLKRAVEHAYEDLDNTIKDWMHDDNNPSSINMHSNGGFASLQRLFVGSSKEMGLFFTLNQDLFLERWCKHRPPGVNCFQEKYYNMYIEFNKNDFIQLPSEDKINEIKKRFENHGDLAYIKLHGSYGWLSSSSRMVIGRNKMEDINSEPILRWYWELFQNALNEGNKKILIIGYSFRDKHVNQLLLEAVDKFGLKIYVISPEEPKKLKQRLESEVEQGALLFQEKETKRIWYAISGYFPYTLKQIFPSSQNTTPFFKEIETALL